MIITSSRSPKGATQAPVLHSCQLEEFGAKTNQKLITLGFFAHARWQKAFTSARTALSENVRRKGGGEGGCGKPCDARGKGREDTLREVSC